MEWQYYHIISLDLVARNTDFGTNDQLSIDGIWVDDTEHIISDRQIGYDGESIGASSMLFDIEEITEEEAVLRMTPLNKMREKALSIASKAHRYQTDKAGEPYLKHPIQVATRFQDDARFIAGLLHDVIEDSKMTIEDLSAEGFPGEIVEAVKVLTKSDTSYKDYIEAIKNNPIARDVKIEDLKHNMDLSRFGSIDKNDLDRVKKYKKSLDYLLQDDILFNARKI